MRRATAREGFKLAPTVHAQMTEELLLLLDSIEPFTAVERFRFQYLRDEILSKYNDPKRGAKDRREKAIAKWRLMERRNEKTNLRLRTEYGCVWSLKRSGDYLSSKRVEEVARRTISRVLGPVPENLLSGGNFTSGASTSFRREPGSLAAKFKVAADVTVDCYPLIRREFDLAVTWNRYRGALVPRVVDGNVLFTVPKNCEIDRVACKEPDLNMYVQKAIGNHIRKRLKTCYGIDLDDQTRNQRLAREGSKSGHLATLDLSSASDLISIGLVELLFPREWFDLLDAARSRVVSVDGESVSTHMLSSMGNAFTFEVETLIFYALVNAIAYCTGARGTISVYGDDIIAPAVIGGLTCKVFSWYGFKVNPKKSYWKGPFRESCGKHWYNGVDVTPFYVRAPIQRVDRAIHLLNRLRSWAEMPGTGICDPRFYSYWERWSKIIPSALFGGWDCERIDMLASPGRPKSRLVPVKEPVEVDECGAYLQWLRDAEDRQKVDDPLITSVVMKEVDRLQLRRVQTGAMFGYCQGRKDIPLWPDEGRGGDLDTHVVTAA